MMKKSTAAFSLLDIMREQKAESSLSEDNIQYNKDESEKAEKIANEYQDEIKDDEILARELTTEYDEDLALEWQNTERAELIGSHPRNFDAIESSYVNLAQNQEESDEYNSDEYEEQYETKKSVKYAAPKNLRTGENETVFKTYSTRNTGVKEFKKQKKFIAKQYKSTVNVFQIKQEDSDYGRIMSPNLNKVYCFWDGLTRKAHVLKKIKMVHNLADGQLVLVKIRRYQESVVDIIHVYSSQEEAVLFEMGEIVTRDPLEHLPAEVIRTVLDHMESQYAMDMLRQVSRSWNIMAKEHSPAKYLPRKVQFERRIKELEWEDLSNYHWLLYEKKIVFNIVSSEHCQFYWASNIYHFKNNCDLRTRVLSIAEEVWNQFAGPTPSGIKKSTEEPLFTFTKCFYLQYKDEQLRNFASLVLWSWIKLHEREDLAKLDIPTYFRTFLVQSARQCVEKCLSGLKAKLTTVPAFQLPAIRDRINFLEQRWKLLVEQPKIAMDEIDFAIESESESYSDSDDDRSREEFSPSSSEDSMSDDPDRDYWKT